MPSLQYILVHIHFTAISLPSDEEMLKWVFSRVFVGWSTHCSVKTKVSYHTTAQGGVSFQNIFLLIGFHCWLYLKEETLIPRSPSSLILSSSSWVLEPRYPERCPELTLPQLLQLVQNCAVSIFTHWFFEITHMGGNVLVKLLEVQNIKLSIQIYSSSL